MTSDATRPRALSLFTGAGGLDLGFEAAGFDTAVAVELDRDAVTTLRANRSWPVIDRDIHTVPSDELLKAAGLREGDADVLIGGPPCQPFSKSGYWASGDTRRLDDERAGTLGAYVRVLRDTLPKTFLLENVPGLAYRRKSEGLDLIRRSIEQINEDKGVHYSLAIAKLNAAEYGVPQLRERVFVIGARDGRTFEFPAPTHGDDSEPDLLTTGPLLPLTTAWDALADLDDETDAELQLRGKWADLLPSIPEGENYLWHTDRGGGLELFGWRRRYWSFLLKLSKRRPSWTLQAKPGPAIGPFHWKNRRLSARELSRIQTFPDDYRVLGRIGAVQKQVGNAVPSGLAEVLARAMRRRLLGDAVDLGGSLIPTRRSDVPPPETPAKVPAKYLPLIGDHAAHPGTGRGYAAKKRDAERAPVSPRLPLAGLAT